MRIYNLKQDSTPFFVQYKDVLNIENLKRRMESLELQLKILKNKLNDKEEAVNMSIIKINSLEEKKIRRYLIFEGSHCVK